VYLNIIADINISNRNRIIKVIKMNSLEIVHNCVKDTVIIINKADIKFDQNIIRRVSQKDFCNTVWYLW